MKSRTTFLLVLCAVVIGGLVLLDQYKGTSTVDLKRQQKQLLNLDGADITHVELVRSSQTIVLDKTGTAWEIKQPLVAPADYGAVNGLVDELQFAERTRTLSEEDLAGIKPADLGLTPPHLTIKMSGKKGPFTINIGGPTPTGKSVYVQVEGQKEVCLTDRYAAQRLDRSLNDLRERTVVDATAVTATRLELKSAGHILELAKSAVTTNPDTKSGQAAEPRWTLVQPLAVRADSSRVGDLLNNLNGLRIVDFVSDDPKDLRTYKLDEPLRQITVWKGASDLGSTLLLGPSPTNDATKVLAKLKGRDSIFTLPADKVKALDVAANDVRDHAIMAFDTAAVQGVELQRGTERMTLQRDGDKWKLTTPVARPADVDAVNNLLDNLHDLNAKQFVADVPTGLEPYGLTVPGLIVSLKGEGTNMLTQVLIGSVNASNGVQYVKLASEPFVYGVETNFATALPANALSLYARRLVELKSEQITRLVIEQASGPAPSGASKTVVERGPDSNWKLVEPANGVLDTDGLRAVLDVLAEMRAEEFIAVTPDCGLDKPALTVTATTAEKNYVLKVGFTQNAETYCASWNDPESVLKISAASFQTLKKTIIKPATAAASIPPAPTTNPPPPAATLKP